MKSNERGGMRESVEDWTETDARGRHRGARGENVHESNAGGDGSDTTAGPVLAHFSHPRAAESTTLAVISDAHVSTDHEGSWKVFHRTVERLETATADATARDVDAIVLPGDLTKDGAHADCEAVESVLADCPMPTLAVPGNHDVPKSFDTHEVPGLDEFEAMFTPGELPFHERVGGLDLIGLNSASAPDGSLADTHAGAISDDEVTWLDDTLSDVETPIVFSHHNLPGLLETKTFSWRASYPVGNVGALVDVLADHDVPLHISGHLHVPAVAASQGVREVVCPSLCSFPQATLLVTVDERGTTIRLVPTADRAGISESYMLAHDDSSHSRAVAELVVDQLRAFPLAVEEQVDEKEVVHLAG